jgi:hypothetical protein
MKQQSEHTSKKIPTPTAAMWFFIPPPAQLKHDPILLFPSTGIFCHN